MAIDVETNAKKPKSMTVDGRTVSQHPMPDQIATDQTVSADAAVAGSKRGFHLSRLKPGGTVV